MSIDNFSDLARLVTLETGHERVTRDTTIKDLGIDSLEFLSLLLAIEHHIGYKLSDELVAQVQTVGDLANVIHPN